MSRVVGGKGTNELKSMALDHEGYHATPRQTLGVDCYHSDLQHRIMDIYQV